MINAIWARLRRNNRPLIISGAGIVGETILDLCCQQDVHVDGFCDGSTKVAGTEFRGYTVVHSPQLKDTFPDALVLITAAAIKDVVDLLAAQGIDSWMAAGPLLEACDIAQPESELDARKFAIETCITCHAAYLHPEHAFLRSVDLIITERCSLRCKDCANLMQYYQRPQNVDFDLLMRSLTALCSVLDEIMELRIIGGDALMNKRWPEIVARATQEDHIKRVVIYTNGAVVPGPDQIRLLKHPKVLMLVTDYGSLSCNMDRLKHYLAENGIAHRILRVDSWLDCASLERHDRTEEDNARIYRDCCAKNMLTLSDGKLFRCPFAANADRLGAVPAGEGDSVNILNGVGADSDNPTLRNRLVNYALNHGPMTACDYCNGRPLAGREVPPAVQIRTPLPYARQDAIGQ